MLLNTRISKPPYPATVIDRPRLYQHLDRWPELRAIVIHAPTGYGKSCLVSRWIDFAGHAPRTAWLSLHESDADPRQFVHHLAAVLDRALPGALALAQPILQDKQGSAERVLTRLFSALWDEAESGSPLPDGHTLLVLDDLHRVQSPEVDAAIRLILELGPDRLHLLLMARHHTPLPLARLYAHGRIVALEAEDLRFTREEVRQFLDAQGFDSPTEAEVAQLATRSEGWVAALQLAVLALRGRGSIADLLQVLHGQNIWLEQYLTDEVLDRQSPDLRRFLLYTSILNQFNAPLCAAVTGDGHAPARLEEAVRGALFLIRLGEGWFRYHHTFQELLQQRLHAQAGADLVADLHQRAAAWLTAAGDVQGAVGHLLAAGAGDQAAALVEEQMRATLLHDPYGAKSLLALLPEDLLAQRPQLMLDRCRIAVLFDDRQALTYTQEAERTLQEQQSSNPANARHHAEWLVLRGIGCYIQHDPSAAGDAVCEAQAHLPYLDDFHLGALQFLQMQLHIGAGEAPEMKETAEAALAAFERAGFALGAVALRRQLAQWSMRRGDSAEATRRFQELFAGGTRDHPSAIRDLTLANFLAAEHSYLQNHLDWARDYQRSAKELALQLNDADLIQVARGLGRILGVESQDGSAAVQDFSEYLRQVTVPTVADLLLDYETRILIASGRSDLAWRILQESGINLQSRPTDIVDHRLIIYLRAAVAENVDPVTTEPALAEALAMTAQSGNRLGQLQLLALTAWQRLKLNGPEAATEALEQAVHLAHETGYVRVLLDIPALATALATAAWLDDETALAALVKGRQLLTEREQEVLALLAENCTYPQMAEKLVISINTVRSHVRHIYRKLAVRCRGQAIRRAQELGLL